MKALPGNVRPKGKRWYFTLLLLTDSREFIRVYTSEYTYFSAELANQAMRDKIDDITSGMEEDKRY